MALIAPASGTWVALIPIVYAKRDGNGSAAPVMLYRDGCSG